MSFSWNRKKDSKAIAITSSKVKDLSDKILYLNDDSLERVKEDKTKVINDITKGDIDFVLTKRIAKRNLIVSDIYNALKNNTEYKSDNPVCQLAYEKLKLKQNKQEDKIELPIGSEFEFLPLMKEDIKDGNMRQSVFISGMPNSGKSYFCKQYLLLYHEIYPKNKIFFISQQDLSKDDSLKEVKEFMEQIKLEDLMSDTEPITWESFIDKPCLVMFDDYDGLQKKSAKRGVLSNFHVVVNLIHNILANARKYSTSCLITSHELNARDGSTTALLKNVDYFVIFTRGIMKYTLEYFCINYLGLDRQLLEEMRKSPSRWYCIRRISPFCMISQYDARIIE